MPETVSIQVPLSLIAEIDRLTPDWLGRDTVVAMLLADSLTEKKTALACGGWVGLGTSNQQASRAVLESPLYKEPSIESSLTTKEALTKEGTEKKEQEKKAKKEQKKLEPYDEKFLAFWAVYQKCPNKAATQTKRESFRHWKKIAKEVGPDALLAAAENQHEAQVKNIEQNGMSTTLPDCMRWLANGAWEAMTESPSPTQATKIPQKPPEAPTPAQVAFVDPHAGKEFCPPPAALREAMLASTKSVSEIDV